MSSLFCAYVKGMASLTECAAGGCLLCTAEQDERVGSLPHSYLVTVPIVDFGPSVVAMQVNAFDDRDALFRAACRTDDEGYEIDPTRSITVEETS